MRIAIDARELCGKPTGVGRYLYELLDQWARDSERDRHEWRVYAHDTPTVPTAFVQHVRVVPGQGGTRWEQWDFARRLSADKPDVLFAPGYTAPLTAPCPVVLTIHDVSFFARPEEFRWREGFRRRQITTWAARRAAVILTVSEFSRQQIGLYIGVPVERVRVIHHGMRMPIPSEAPPLAGEEQPQVGLRLARGSVVLPASGGQDVAQAGPEDLTRVQPMPALATSGGLPSREPLVLYVGSLFPRRHVDLLVSAFGQTVTPQVPGARLEIVGEDRLPPTAHHPADWVRGLPEPVRSRVVFRSWVDEETLEDLYTRASVFAFLSDYEGFGLTPLEALAAGVPPVVLDTPVAREVYGEAAHYILRTWAAEAGRGQTPRRDLRTVESTVENSAELGDALVELLTKEPARAEVLRHAPAVLARYRWDRAAKETLTALSEAAGA